MGLVTKLFGPGAANTLKGIFQNPTNVMYLLLAFVLPLVLFYFLRKGDKKYMQRANIVANFLKELSAGASPGHDKKLFSMFHKKLLLLVEKGLIRAMSKCLHEECGSFEGFDAPSLEIKEGKAKSGEHVTMLVGKANFAKKKNIDTSASWVVDERGHPQFINFSVDPPEGEERFNVFKYVDPNEFEQFGERFAVSLFKKEPTHALNVMCDSLKKKYNSEADLAKEVSGVMKASGGLKNKTSIDIAMNNAQVVFAGDVNPQTNEPNKSNGITLQYHVLGALRDIRCTVKIVFINMRCQVIRYSMEALKPNQQNVIVDQETGTKTVVN